VKQVSEIERRDVNRDLKQVQVMLAEYKDVPDGLARIDVVAETQQRQQLQLKLSAINSFEYKYDDLSRRAERLQQELDEINKQLTDMVLERPNGDAEQLQSEISAIDELVRNASLADKSEKKAQLQANEQAFSKIAEEKTQLLEELAALKVKMIEESQLPGPLGFDEDSGLTYEGQVIEARGDSRGILAGVEVGAALNPELKVILINSGGEVDPTTMQLLSRRAHELGMLILMVRQIPANPDKINFVIDDGVVKESAE
jgi:hypothetical protein